MTEAQWRKAGVTDHALDRYRQRFGPPTATWRDIHLLLARGKFLSAKAVRKLGVPSTKESGVVYLRHGSVILVCRPHRDTGSPCVVTCYRAA